MSWSPVARSQPSAFDFGEICAGRDIIGLRAVLREQPIRRSAELILKALTTSDARTASRCGVDKNTMPRVGVLFNTKRLERQLERAQYLLAGAAAGCVLISRARRMAVTKSSAVKVEISRVGAGRLGRIASFRATSMSPL